MKVLYAFAFVCLSAPAFAGSLGTPTAAIDPATIWHEFDYDVVDGKKVAKLDPAEIWHEFDYDLKNGIKVAKTYPATIELVLELKQAIQTAEIWHEFDYDLKDGVKVAKAYPSLGQESDPVTTASIPAPAKSQGE